MSFTSFHFNEYFRSYYRFKITRNKKSLGSSSGYHIFHLTRSNILSVVFFRKSLNGNFIRSLFTWQSLLYLLYLHFHRWHNHFSPSNLQKILFKYIVHEWKVLILLPREWNVYRINMTGPGYVYIYWKKFCSMQVPIFSASFLPVKRWNWKTNFRTFDDTLARWSQQLADGVAVAYCILTNDKLISYRHLFFVSARL